MKKYMKKPVVIEAIQFIDTPDQISKISDFVDKTVTIDYSAVATTLTIYTLEGILKADVKDWIIKGVKGEFYPCKPDIFEMTYKEVS